MSENNKMKIPILIGVFGILILSFLFYKVVSVVKEVDTETAFLKNKKVVIYKSSSCGCCKNYALYMKREGFDVEVVDVENMDMIKEKYNIPNDMESCHTAVYGDKVIEGHVPAKVVREFLKDDSVDTIAMPNMPSGSPGMPGVKDEMFKIYKVKDGIIGSIFMEI